MEVRELRYFVAVAEELNFTRAAARLGMAQPPLSRAIRGLERRLGADLFIRDPHGVVLTHAGSTLLAEARTVLEAVAAATNRTRRAAQPSNSLVATAKPGAATALLRAIAESFDGPVEIIVGGYGDQAELVRDGRADVALVGSPVDPRGIDLEPLRSERRVAALPGGHVLARRAVLRLADLARQPFPRWVGSSAREHSYWTGPAPLDGPRVADVSQMLEVIGLGQAVALVPESVARANPRPDISFRAVVDAAPYTTSVAWRTGSRDLMVARFVQAALAEAGGDGAGEPVRAARPVLEKQ